jgi:predicted CoA-binding protein
VVGASNDRRKFGNKSLRAHLHAGFEAYPVNPNQDTIEGLKAYPKVTDVPVPLDRVTVYLPPEKTLSVLADIAAVKPGEVFLNPGSESAEVVERAGALGLELRLACSIVDIGESPADY